MSSPIQYHTVQPDNNSPNGFTEFNTLDFTLLADGRKMMKNSVRLNFVVNFLNAAGNQITTEKVSIDNSIGALGLFESFQTEVQSKGIIENLQDAARFHSVHAHTSLNEGDYFSAKYQSEGRQPIATSPSPVLQKTRSKGSQAAQANYQTLPSFSVKPLIAVNRMAGDDYSFSKNGYIKISANLARLNHALFGADLAATFSYNIQDVSLTFSSVPDDGKQGAVLMNSAITIKSTINSSQANIQARVPSKSVNGVVLTFLELEHESSFVDNSYRLERYPAFEEVSYRFNNSMNKYLNYKVVDEGDAVRKGLSAMNDGGHNQASQKNLAASSGYLMGLAFEEYVDLSSQKFSIDLVSGANISAAPRLVFSHFQCLVEL
jgi:hypothetical protein